MLNGRSKLLVLRSKHGGENLKRFFRTAAAAVLVLCVSVFGTEIYGAQSCPDEVCAVNSAKRRYVALGGDVFGIKLYTKGVIVVDTDSVTTASGSVSPADYAGLKCGDVITHINGVRMANSQQLTDFVEKSQGKALKLTVERDGGVAHLNLKPQLSVNGKYKVGIWVRDSSAGIGTVTFIDPETGMFAGLGHGICDSETGELVPISYGTCEEVELTEIIKGKKGAPGELRGFFTGKKTGKIVKNTLAGIVGALCEIPQNLASCTYPVGAKEKLHSGKATVITTVEGEVRGEYEIVISEIDLSGGQKNFTVEITDPVLIEKTGGIVQGMSGSPIIQDGFIVGAVTHVMVGDPTRGYGIFIENMLSQMALAG